MDSKIWGPPLWFFLHSATLGYPEKPTSEDKYGMRILFDSLKITMPCTCKYNFRKELEILPLTDEILDSKEKLVKWLIDVHNLTNKNLGKPQKSYREVLQFYYDAYNKKTNHDSNICHSYGRFIIIVLLIVLVITLTIYFKNRK